MYVLAIALCLSVCLSDTSRSFTKTTERIELIFTGRRYASAVYAVVVCLSVHLSVCHTPVLYQNGTTYKGHANNAIR